MDTNPHDHDPQQTARDAHTEQMVSLAKLWASASPTVESFVAASVRDPHDRDDVIQATSEYLARNFDKFEPGTSFVGWAVSVARFRVLELWRDRSRDRLVLTGDALESLAEVAVEMQGQASERHRVLGDCIDRLGKGQRRILDMRYGLSMRPAAIGEELGKSANSVSAALLRVRKALRQCIEARLKEAEA